MVFSLAQYNDVAKRSICIGLLLYVSFFVFCLFYELNFSMTEMFLKYTIFEESVVA